MSLFLLGSPHIKRDGISVAIEIRKAMALLVYLGVTAEAHRRDTLATLLWPDADQQRARGSLRYVLVVLKKALGDKWLRADRQTINLNWEADIQVDVHRFRDIVRTVPDKIDEGTAAALGEAIALYRGDFLKGFTLSDSTTFDEWLLFESESLRQAHMQTLESLVTYYQSQNKVDEAIVYARQWVGLDGWHEPAHCTLMMLYTQAGQRAAAIRQYEECARVLADELSVQPSAETTALYEAIRQGTVETVSPENIGVGTAVAPRHNLPPSPNRFINRDRERAEISQMLMDPNCRLLTLVGPGGIGKTRLAIQTVIENLPHLPYQVQYINLAPLTTAHFLLPTVADTLGLTFHNQQDAQKQLIMYLRGQQTLLLLDNFEHLLDGLDLLMTILARTTHTKLLITSRQSLNLQEEWLYTVNGLEIPDAVSIDTPAADGAVQLFAERGRQVRHNFSLMDEWDDVVHICKLVNGMPLGIELAAAWVKVLSCADIAQEIEQNLDFLVTSYHNVNDRHHSLRAVFEHSWQLLSAAEQQAMARLSVFQGGFTREAAVQVTRVHLLTLSSLVNKSLVQYAQRERYELHPLWQQYAGEKLDGETAVYEQHAKFYGRLLKQQEPLLSGQDAPQAINTIRADIQNIRAGWQWGIHQKNEDILSHYIISLHDFYATLNWYQEGNDVLAQAWQALSNEALLDPTTNPEHALLLAKIMARQAEFQYELGHVETAHTLLQESLIIVQHLNNFDEILFIYRLLGIIAYHQGDYQQAHHYLQQSLAFDQTNDKPSHKANIYLVLGAVMHALGDYKQAQIWCQKSLHIYQTIKKAWGIAHAYRSLGRVTQALGHSEEAKQQYQQSLRLFEKLKNPIGIALCLNHLGAVVQARGDFAQAKEWFQQGLHISQDNELHIMQAHTLNHLGEVTMHMGDYATSKAYLHQAIETAVQIKATPALLQGLLHIATLATKINAERLPADNKKSEHHHLLKALELFTLVAQHPASQGETRRQAQSRQVQVARQLPPEIVDTILKNTGSLDTFVTMLLTDNKNEHATGKQGDLYQ